uniref:Protein EARLY HEADING DATE 2 n=1 Tax=Anthurium amnicola TaxID=1678845 RepID=A0A1D1XPR5_9ARAE
MAAPPPFFTIGDQEDLQNQIKQQQQQSSSTPASSAGAPPHAAPQKKRRNLPGTPNPDAEVIALSPKTLLATNRFICEVCNKGFQREQNLQLHRRGHNLPWKLRQKTTTKEVKRRVYLCPEPTCVHHDPSRALGDLTGIKKHFCRKHGEKKWKCDKCSKRYAVQSDWKAHSKTCGTREYRCDCGTLFSRRDSFITHRAFCDALAQESARLPTGLNTIGGHLYGSSHMGLGLPHLNSQISTLQDHSQASTDLLRLGGSGGFNQLISPSDASSLRPSQPGSSPAFFLGGSSQDLQESQPHQALLQNKQFHGLMQLSDLQNGAASSPSAVASPAANLFNLSFFSNSSGTNSINTSNNTAGNQNSHLLIPNQFSNSNASAEAAPFFPGTLMSDHMGSGMSSLYNTTVQNESVLPQMSATALLQKAAQMGSATSNSGSSFLRGFGNSSSSSHAKATNFMASFAGGSAGGQGMRTPIENETHLQDLMNSLANGSAGIFGGGSRGAPAFGGSCTTGGGHEQQAAFGGFDPSLCNIGEARLPQNLSIRNVGGSDGLTRDFLGVGSMVRGMGGGMSQREQHRGIGVSSLDPEMKSASASMSFASGNLQ